MLAWRKLRWYGLLLALAANIFVWSQVWRAHTHNVLTFAMLDVGQGDALFIEDAAGHQILIDGGPGQAILSALPRVLSLNDRYLDLLILSHPHTDHLDGLLEIIQRYQVGAVLESGAVYQSATYDTWHRMLAEKNIPIINARRGEVIPLAGDAELDILAPFEDWRRRSTKEIHESMVVSRLEQKGRGLVMLTGDMEMPLEQELINASDDLKSEILKVGHHGSQTSTSEEFVKAVNPEVALISVAEKNKYGLPYPKTLERLEKLGLPVRMTKGEGTMVYKFGAE